MFRSFQGSQRVGLNFVFVSLMLHLQPTHCWRDLRRCHNTQKLGYSPFGHTTNLPRWYRMQTEPLLQFHPLDMLFGNTRWHSLDYLLLGLAPLVQTKSRQRNLCIYSLLIIYLAVCRLHCSGFLLLGSIVHKTTYLGSHFS